MPSPFPGMDPYLEGDFWTSFHLELAVDIARHLNPKLLPKYTAHPNRRWVTTVIEGTDITSADIVPDVSVRKPRPDASASTATLIPPAPLSLPTALPVKLPYDWVEIRDVQEHQLVTSIELLSPANKRGDGRAEYIAKRERILASSAHLIEIDLHRSGQRVPIIGELPHAPYFVFLARADRRLVTDIWPIYLTDRLPQVPVPLRSPDPDVALELQACFDGAYDQGAYYATLDYRREPPVRLQAHERTFVAKRLAAWTAGQGTGP